MTKTHCVEPELKDVHERLALHNPSASGRVFETQVLAGSSSLDKSFVCLDSKETLKFIKGMKESTSVFEDEQLRDLLALASLFATLPNADPKLVKIHTSKQVHGTDWEIDGLLSRRLDTETTCADAHEALMMFLARSATHFCKLSSMSELQHFDPTSSLFVAAGDGGGLTAPPAGSKISKGGISAYKG